MCLCESVFFTRHTHALSCSHMEPDICIFFLFQQLVCQRPCLNLELKKVNSPLTCTYMVSTKYNTNTRLPSVTGFIHHTSILCTERKYLDNAV